MVLAELGAKPITLVVLVCGMMVTFGQYQAYLKNGRVEKSFKLVEEWETDRYQKAWSSFSKSIREHEQVILKKLGPDTDLQTGPALSFIHGQFADPDETTADAITTLYYFFDKMSLCIEQELCDRALLVDFFGSAVFSFWTYTIPFQKEMQDRTGDFGKFTEQFLQSLTR